MPDIGGSYSATQNATLTFNEWWLKNPINSTYNLAVEIANSDFKRSRKEEQSVYEPLGRPMPVVIRGVMRGERYPLIFEFLTKANWQKFENLRNQQATLLLQRGYTNEEWYGSLGAAREITEARYDANYKLIECEFIETDAP